jgi:hypothetical protein
MVLSASALVELVLSAIAAINSERFMMKYFLVVVGVERGHYISK